MARAKMHRDVVEVCGDDGMQGQESAEVIEISSEEYREAVSHALSEVGLTYPQLRAEARTGRFRPSAPASSG